MNEAEISTLHRNLKERGKGAKDWSNGYTEHEYLGNGVFIARIGLGRKAFKDKVAGIWKKHRLTDNLPNHVILQSARCCVEVYPWHATYFDPGHEEIRVKKERWALQRLFKEPDKWKVVDAKKPVMSVEETEDTITASIVYETDYGPLTIKYIQKDGHDLKHDILFVNASGGVETFRVLQSLSGIAADRINRKEIAAQEELDDEALYFRKGGKTIFRESFQEYNLTKEQEVLKGSIEWVKVGECNHCGLCCTRYHCPHYVEAIPHCDKYEDRTFICQHWPYNHKCFIAVPECTVKLEPSGKRHYPTKLRSRLVDVHSKGLKADIEYGLWELQPGESFKIDPASATIYDTNDASTGYTSKGFDFNTAYMRFTISGIPEFSTINSADLYFYISGVGDEWDDDLYIARVNDQACDPENDSAPVLNAYAVTDETLYEDITSTGWVDKDWATPLQKDIGSTYHSIRMRDPDSELSDAYQWEPDDLAIGKLGPINGDPDEIYIYVDSHRKNGNDAYLDIVYTPAWEGKIMGVQSPDDIAKIMGIDIMNVAKIMGVEGD